MFDVWKKKKKKMDIATLLKKAKENDMNAQYELALAYYRGSGVEKNIEKTNYWFEKANNQSKCEGV